MDATGRIDAAYPLLALCSIELWCRIFLDRREGRSLSHISGRGLG
jgi:hypothetical protein